MERAKRKVGRKFGKLGCNHDIKLHFPQGTHWIVYCLAEFKFFRENENSSVERREKQSKVFDVIRELNNEFIFRQIFLISNWLLAILHEIRFCEVNDFSPFWDINSYWNLKLDFITVRLYVLFLVMCTFTDITFFAIV